MQTWQNAGILAKEMELYKRYSENGWQVNLITYGDKNDLEIAKDYGFVRVFCNQWKLPERVYKKNIPWLFSEVLSKTSLIKIHQIGGGDLAMEAAQIWQKPFLLRCGYLSSYTGEERLALGRLSKSDLEKLNLLENALFHFANKAIVTTEPIKNYVCTQYSIAESKVSVIANGVDLNHFHPDIDHSSREGVIFVGRLSPEKNLENLILACHDLRLKLTLVGDGPEKENLERLVSSLDATVDFSGIVDSTKLPRVLEGAKMFCLVSLYEGNPKALLEAMSMGMPVLGSDVKGINEIISDGENGILCLPSRDGIREGLQRILDLGEKAQSLGLNARHYIEEHNDIEKQWQKEIALAEKILAETPFVKKPSLIKRLQAVLRSNYLKTRYGLSMVWGKFLRKFNRA